MINRLQSSTSDKTFACKAMAVKLWQPHLVRLLPANLQQNRTHPVFRSAFISFRPPFCRCDSPSPYQSQSIWPAEYLGWDRKRHANCQKIRWSEWWDHLRHPATLIWQEDILQPWKCEAKTHCPYREPVATGIVTSITAVAENRSSVPVGNSQNSHHRPENSPKTQRSCPKIQPPNPHQFSHSLDRNSSHAECQRWISTIQSLEIARSKLKPEQNSLNNHHWIGLRDFKGPIYSTTLYISW